MNHFFLVADEIVEVSIQVKKNPVQSCALLASIEGLVKHGRYIIALLGVFALIIAYITTMFRAARLGVPFRHMRMKVWDGIETVVSLLAGLFLGLAIPLYTMTLEDVEPLLKLLFSFVSIFGGYAAIAPYGVRAIQTSKRRNRLLTVGFYAIFVLLSLTASLVVSSLSSRISIYSAIILMFHLIIFTVLFFIWLIKHISGTYDSESIVVIEGETYLVGIAHTGSMWALFPCVTLSKKVIYYERGRYILEKFENIKGLITLDFHSLKALKTFEELKAMSKSPSKKC